MEGCTRERERDERNLMVLGQLPMPLSRCYVVLGPIGLSVGCWLDNRLCGLRRKPLWLSHPNNPPNPLHRLDSSIRLFDQ